MQVTGRDADQVRVEQNGDQITVLAPQRTGFLSGDSRLDVAVTIPTDSDLAVKTGSADITVDGTLGSGKIKSGSGDVQLDTFGGPPSSTPARATSGSRRRSPSCGSRAARARSTSAAWRRRSRCRPGPGRRDRPCRRADRRQDRLGDLKVVEAQDDVSLTTGSGDLIGTAQRGRLTAKGASGDVRVGIPPCPRLDRPLHALGRDPQQPARRRRTPGRGRPRRAARQDRQRRHPLTEV